MTSTSFLLLLLTFAAAAGGVSGGVTRKTRLSDNVDSATSPNSMNHHQGLPETRVGDTFPINISLSATDDDDKTQHTDNNSIAVVDFTMTNKKWIWTINHPGATYLSVHFQHFYLAEVEGEEESNYCFITIKDRDYHIRDVLKMNGRANGTFWSHHVRYDTMLIEYQCSEGRLPTTTSTTGSSLSSSSFLIDKYAAGFADITNHDHINKRRRRRNNERDLTICSNDDKRNAICWEEIYPEEYDKAKAVAKLLVQGTNVCTGFLVGQHNYLLTNWHCINTQIDAVNTDFTFLYEAKSGSCLTGGIDDPVVADDYVIYSGESLIKEDFDKDYSLVKLIGDPVSQYG